MEMDYDNGLSRQTELKYVSPDTRAVYYELRLRILITRISRNSLFTVHSPSCFIRALFEQDRFTLTRFSIFLIPALITGNA